MRVVEAKEMNNFRIQILIKALNSMYNILIYIKVIADYLLNLVRVVAAKEMRVIII